MVTRRLTGYTAPADARALIVDDDPIMRSLYKAKLSKIAREVVEAGDGMEAWSLLAKDRFNLVIVDLMMPNIDGISLIQCVRGHPHLRHIPIVVVTSNTDIESINGALEAGASAFMTKPLTWSLFADHVTHLLRLSKAEEEADLRVRRLTELSAAQSLLISAIGTVATDALALLEDCAQHSSSGNGMTAKIRGESARKTDSCQATLRAHTLIRTSEQVNTIAQPLRRVLDRAVVASSKALRDRQQTVSFLSVDRYSLLCSLEAIGHVIATCLADLSVHTPFGSRIFVEASLSDGMFHLLLSGEGIARTATDGIDIVLPESQLNSALLIAHGATLRARCVGGEVHAFEIGFPVDRVGRGPGLTECAA